MKRDSFVMYRSFMDAIMDLPEHEQLEVFYAIADYSLNFKKPKLTGLPGTIFKLIQPQLDANNKRYLNGIKGGEHGIKGGRPKGNKTPKKPLDKPQKNPKQTPNVNDNVNDNDNVNEDIHPMWLYVIDNYPTVSKLNAMTPEQCDKLKETYTHEQIIDVLDAMENHKGLTKKYVDCYKTVNNWLKRRSKTDKEDTPNNPFKYGVSL